jgi:hypothetical protein
VRKPSDGSIPVTLLGSARSNMVVVSAPVPRPARGFSKVLLIYRSLMPASSLARRTKGLIS